MFKLFINPGKFINFANLVIKPLIFLSIITLVLGLIFALYISDYKSCTAQQCYSRTLLEQESEYLLESLVQYWISDFRTYFRYSEKFNVIPLINS